MDELQRIHKVVRQRGGKLIVDEIYHGLTYGTQVRSALELADDIFVINSFSKYFCMTGWRLGWVVASDEYIVDLERLAQNLYISNSDVAMLCHDRCCLARDVADRDSKLSGNCKVESVDADSAGGSQAKTRQGTQRFRWPLHRAACVHQAHRILYARDSLLE